MSLFSFRKPDYAETHYKFKLPWSLLYRPWPEIIIDAPFQVIPGQKLSLWIVVRDADRFPVRISSISVCIKNSSGEKINFKQPLNIETNKLLHFFPVELPLLKPGKYHLFPKLIVHSRKRKKIIRRWNLPGLMPKPLQVQILKETPPCAPGFVLGETHCHTHYSSDPVEFGAPPEILQQVARDIGLHFVLTADHAYDFAFEANNYMKPTLPEERFKQFKKEIAALAPNPLMIAGEEVSVGNALGENIHMLVPGPDSYIPGLGDCGRNWFNNNPTLSVSEVLNRTSLPCFAAHPKVPMGKLERFIFRRGEWSTKDLCLNEKNKIRGLQFWNGPLDEGFQKGRRWWIEELEKGNFLLPIGGNDAHGDFNDTTGVSFPLFSLKHSRNHVFGRVRTALVANLQKLNPESVIEAFQKDRSYITNGPALWWEFIEGSLYFLGKSSSDYGKIKSVHLFAQTQTKQKETTVHAVFPENIFEFKIRLPLESFIYARAECTTEQGHFALTSAAFYHSN